MNTNITRKRKRGPGPDPTSASSCDAAGRSAGAKKRRGLRNKIIAQNADEVNDNVLQGTASIKIEAKDADEGPEMPGGVLEGKGSRPVDKASVGTTVSVGRVQRGSKLKGG